MVFIWTCVDMPFSIVIRAAMSHYHHVAIEQRGSVVIPASVRKSLGLVPGSCCVLREYNGLIFIVPGTEADASLSPDQIHHTICERLDKPLSPPPPTPPLVSKTATAEALKLQASRERHAMRMEVLRAQAELAKVTAEAKASISISTAKAKAGVRAVAQPAKPEHPAYTVPPGPDPLERLMKAREEASNRRLEAAIREASEDIAAGAAEAISLPQA